MTLANVADFLLWCTLINGGILLVWTVLFLLAKDFIYGFHSKIFLISKEDYHQAILSALGWFKILFIIFNLTPWIVFNCMVNN